MNQEGSQEGTVQKRYLQGVPEILQAGVPVHGEGFVSENQTKSKQTTAVQPACFAQTGGTCRPLAGGFPQVATLPTVSPQARDCRRCRFFALVVTGRLTPFERHVRTPC